MTQNEQKVHLTLSIHQLNTVLAGIVKLPIEIALDTFTTIQQQAQQQIDTSPKETKNIVNGPLSNKVVQ
jgi:hypothetical protein